MPVRSAVARDLRRVNRGSLLRLLFLDGPLNRVELGRLTGLSSGSVTNLCAAMLEEGLIVEAGHEQSEGGRPRVQLEVNPEFGTVVGVEVGEGGIRVESFDFTLGVLGVLESELRPQEHQPNVTVDAIVEMVAKLCVDRSNLIGVGIAVPGAAERYASERGPGERAGDGARVQAPSIGWTDVPLEQLARERLGVPVCVENGAKALGQVEMWLGAGRGSRNAVVTLWGTGVGAAIFVDGALYRGASSSAGEWGHTCIAVGGRACRCGSRGCLEAYIGGAGLLESWRELDPQAPGADPDTPDWADALLCAAAERDQAARTLDQAATCFGVAAANLVNLFNPELIVVGGVFGIRFGPDLLDRIRDVMTTQALAYAVGDVELAIGRFGTDAVALGASTLVVAELLAGGGLSWGRTRPELALRTSGRFA